MTRALQRIVQVRVGPPGGEGKMFGNTNEGGLGLHIGFSTKSGDSGRPSECRVSIFNLKPESRTMMGDPKNLVRLRVGHKTRGLKTVFQGNPTPDTLTTRKTGGDQVTEVTIRDGGRGYDTGRLNISIRGKTTPRQVLNEVLAATGWGEGVIDLGDFAWQRRFVFSGTARVAMDLLTSAPAGNRRWFVRDGNLYVLKVGVSSPEEAPVFSSDSGNLIGSPEPVDGGGVRLTAILDATMRVGRVFQVKSKDINGFFTAVGVDFIGTNYDGGFYVKVKGVARA